MKLDFLWRRRMRQRKLIHVCLGECSVTAEMTTTITCDDVSTVTSLIDEGRTSAPPRTYAINLRCLVCNVCAIVWFIYQSLFCYLIAATTFFSDSKNVVKMSYFSKTVQMPRLGGVA